MLIFYIPVTGIDNDCTWPIHSSNHDHAGTIQIHGINGIVKRVGPVNLLLGPVIRYTLRVNFTADDCFYLVVDREVTRN